MNISDLISNKHNNANSLNVSNAQTEEEKFEVESTPCGGSLTKDCLHDPTGSYRIIELLQNYGPGLECTWTFNHEQPIEYKFEVFKVSQRDKFAYQNG